MTTKRMQNPEAIQNAKEMLAKFAPAGTTVYTKVLHVAKSGMSREIALYVVHNGEIVEISAWVAYVAGFSFNRDRFAVKVGGCGMDMCFHVVYTLANKLYSDGYALTKRDL